MHGLLLFVSSSLLLLLGDAAAHSPSEWRTRTIYQIITDRFAKPSAQGWSDGEMECVTQETYCGGTFGGIEAHLDYITGMGFDAIWISPVPANIGDNYHGYAASDLYVINPHFGGADGLHSLIKACHSRDVWVMFDVVGNHMGIPGNYDYSRLTPFNEAKYFHSCESCPSNCWIDDFGNQPQVQMCRLDGLPDLNQTEPYVAETLTAWVHALIGNFSADGIRVDTVPEVNKPFWRKFQQAAGVYGVGEVFNGDVDYVASYQNAATDAVLSYPLFFTIVNVFAQQQSMYGLQSLLQSYEAAFDDLSLLGTFVDNHDNPRFLSYTFDVVLYANALVFALFTQGIPIVYYGTEQLYDGASTPMNRYPLWPTKFSKSSRMYQYLSAVIAFRKQTIARTGKPVPGQTQSYADDSFYAFTRDAQVFVALTNVGTNGGSIHRTISYQPWNDGAVLCNMFAKDECVTVQDGQFVVDINDGYPLILRCHKNC